MRTQQYIIIQQTHPFQSKKARYTLEVTTQEFEESTYSDIETDDLSDMSISEDDVGSDIKYYNEETDNQMVMDVKIPSHILDIITNNTKDQEREFRKG